MANIPIRDIPGAVVASPDPSNLIPMDNGSIMQKTTIANAVNTTLPLSSQAEAEAGVDNAKRMSPLRTKQAIDAQAPVIVNTAITALNLGTMSQEDASDYTPTSGLAAVALSNDYDDLDNLPTLGTMAAETASDYTKTTGLGGLALKDKVSISDIDATGTADNTTYLRGDGSWSAAAGGSVDALFTEDLGKTPGEQAQARENIGLEDGSDGQVRVMDSGAPGWADSIPFAEGVFTPGFTFGTPGNLSVSYGARFGYYTRIGNRVFFELVIYATPTFTSASGGAIIDGLPFEVSVEYDKGQAGAGKEIPIVISNVNFGSGKTFPLIRLQSGSSSGVLYAGGTNTNASAIAATGFSSGQEVRVHISGSYLVD